MAESRTNPIPPLTVGVDVGGTKVLAGLVDADGRVWGRLRRETPGRSSHPQVVEDTVARAVDEVAAGQDVAAVGVGAAGYVDADGEVVRFSPHLSWRDEPLRAALETRIGLPVVLDNDANTMAVAEYRYGAARGHDAVVCVTLGTGMGGAVLLGGAVYRGSNGMAGEFGHMQVVPDGPRCHCGNRGCLEQFASGSALVREARELVATGSPAAHGLADGLPDEEEQAGPVITRLALAGDPAAVELFGEVGRWLGVGVANIAAALDPAVVVVGGGVAEAGALLLDPARRSLASSLTGRGYRRLPDVVAAELGPDAGFVGAATLARERLLGQSRLAR